jgi:hypothetical protein
VSPLNPAVLTRLDGAVAVRLMHELEGLLRGIEADRQIVPVEVRRVETWLEAARPFATRRPFSELFARAELALADGVLTRDEIEDLLFVTSTLTTVNPRYDAMRSGIQVLHGLLAGIAADGMVVPQELAALQAWVDAWRHLQGLWPFDECEALVAAAVAQPAHAGEAAAALLALANQMPVGGDDPHPGVLPAVRGLCDEDPTIIFPGHIFAFTGDSHRCSRDQIEARVTARGGVTHPRVTRDIDYLIVCDGGCPHWAFSCYGRKLEHAKQLRQQGAALVIVHEADFWDALALS